MPRVVASMLGALCVVLPCACGGPVAPASPPSATPREQLGPPPASASTPAVASASASVAPACRVLPPLAPLPTLGAKRQPPAVPTPGLSAGLPADAPAPLVAACARLEARNRLAARTRPRIKMEGVPDPDAPPRRRGVCFGNAKGAWIADVSAFRRGAFVGIVAQEATWELLFVTPSGALVRPAARDGTPAPRGKLTISLGEWDGDVGIVGAHDFDGDGVLEVLVDEHVYTAIDDASDTVSAWTKRDEGVVPTQTQASIAGWLDVDGDGRLDVLRIGPRGDETYPLVEHTMAGGRPSPDDVVAQSAWRRLCPAPPRGPLRTTRAVHCALVWGAKRDEVEGRIDDARTDGSCREAQRRIARDSPSPVSLVGVCPSNEAAVATTPNGFDFTPCQ